MWQDGDALVFGIWRQMENAWFSPKTGTLAGKPVPARITFPEARHVYDLRARKYLGSVAQVDAQLRWGRASFYLALPYRIGEPQVSLSMEAPTPGETITAAIRLGVPAGSMERLAAWVEVTDPAGQKPLWGQQVVLLSGGEGQVQFQTAYNDAPGRWTVKATELFSGQSAEASWTVR